MHEDATMIRPDDPDHRAWALRDAARQLDLFRASLDPAGGFFQLGRDGTPVPGRPRELHATARLVHSYALGKLAGFKECDTMIDAGMRDLSRNHRDSIHGGYLWSLDADGVRDGRKLAYGHVFVLLAGSSALAVGHPDAQALIDDVTEVLDARFWEDGTGRFCDEFNRDWTPFSDYRGMNANMHGIEALLAAHEATGADGYLAKASRILDFFLGRIAPAHGDRLPEHYHGDWSVDLDYSADPMFRPAGTTPGHSFEMARLLLQYWDMSGRADETAPARARALTCRALADAWDPTRGGLVYTLHRDGTPDISDRYWWPVTEAIGVLAALMKLGPTKDDALWFDRLWRFAKAHFVDAVRGGWFPEIDDAGHPTERQFIGKPDIYHALQADLFPLTAGLSGYYTALKELRT